MSLRRPLVLAVLGYLCVVADHTSAFGAKPSPPFPEHLSVDSVSMVKLGEYRYVYRFFFDLYDVALYAEEGATPEDVLTRDRAFRLQFRYLREIDKSIILKSATRMLEKNLSEDAQKQIEDRVAALNEAYVTVRQRDRSSLTFLPEIGTILEINGERVKTVPGRDFADYYFEIWLGRNPISTSMKQTLLRPTS